MSEENAAESQGYTGAEGSDSFLSDLVGENLASNEMLAGMELKSGGDFAQKYIDLHTSNEELKSNQPAGAPENGVEGYTFDAPEGVPVDEAAMGVFKDFALSKGMSNDMFQEIANFDVARTQQIQKALKEKAETGIAELKTEHGDNYEPMLNQINKVLLAVGGEDLVKRLDAGNDPDFFKFMAKIGSMISEDSLERGSGGDSGSDSRPKDETGKHALKFKDMPAGK